MAKLKYVEREAAKHVVCYMCEYSGTENCEGCEHPIYDIHVANVSEIVRCKDCIHQDPEDHKCDCGEMERAGCIFKVSPNYFCAYGKRRVKRC